MYLPTFAEIMQVAQSRGADSEAPGLWRGLAGSWPLQETGGLTAFDASGSQNHGTLTNMDPATDRVVALKGRALDFDGSDDHVATSFFPFLAPPFSLAAWIKIPNVAADQNYHSVMSRGAVWESNTNFAFGYRYTEPGAFRRVFCYWRNNAALYGAEKNTAAINQTWMHIAASIDHVFNLSLYFDGSLVGTDASNLVPTDGAQNLYIGRPNTTTSTDRYFLGQSTGHLIFSRVLSPAEIRRLYADPWAMYRLRPRVVFRGWTAPSFKPAWVRRSSQIIGGGVA